MVLGPSTTLGATRGTASESETKYRVKFLVDPTDEDPRERDVPSTWLQWFDYASCVVTDELLAQATYFSSKKWELELILDVRGSTDEEEVLVLWTTGEQTWEPFTIIYKDCPEAIQSFLSREDIPTDRLPILDRLAERVLRGRVGIPKVKSKRSAKTSKRRPANRA